MVSKLGYDSCVRRLNSATVAVILAGAFIFLVLLRTSHAQINGTPASVTSTNFGGHLNSTPGVPASITSLGPNGFQPGGRFSNQRSCCINWNPPLIRRHRHQRGQFFPGGDVVYVPYTSYAYPVVGEYEAGDAVPDQQGYQPEEEYRGGPTIFDRRGPGTPGAYDAGAHPHRPSQPQTETALAAPPAEESLPDQPPIVLVFKDSHQLEVQNYAVIGDTLYDLTPGRHHKILLADLDLTSTTKQNDDRGIDFRLPPGPETKK